MSDSVDAKPEDVTLVEPEELNEMIFGDADQTGEVSVISQPTKSEKPRKRAPRKSKSEGGEASATPKPKRAKKVAVAVEATASSQAETQEEASSAQAGEGNTDTAETPEAVAVKVKVDRRRGKITDPEKLAARREQLAKMRDKALAARSANAKRAKALKEAAAWKKKQEEESLLAAYTKHISTDSQTVEASAPAEQVEVEEKKAEPAKITEQKEAKVLPTPPDLPKTEEAAVPPVSFAGYRNATNGWVGNPTGIQLPRYRMAPTVGNFF